MMVPAGEILRTRKLLLSAMYKFPAPSRATPVGPLSCALEAAPPSPEKPALKPLPATVEMMPADEIERMRLFDVSATYRFPAPSRVTSFGQNRLALVAADPSPEKPGVPL